MATVACLQLRLLPSPTGLQKNLDVQGLEETTMRELGTQYKPPHDMNLRQIIE